MNSKIERIKELVHSIDELEKELEILLCNETTSVEKTGPVKRAYTKRVPKELVEAQEEIMGVKSSTKKHSGRGRPVGWKKGQPYKLQAEVSSGSKSGIPHLNWYCDDCSKNFATGTDIEMIACPACQSTNTFKSKYQEFEI